MPTVGIPRDPLFAGLGLSSDFAAGRYTVENFEELCFEFGIELDEEVEEEVKGTKTRGVAGEVTTEVVYKIEVPANRYDILCLEGMVRALNVFLGRCPPPEFVLLPPKTGAPLEMTVEAPTAQIRPFVVAAVLRDCTFTERAYNSFLDLQDRMHHNICRRRTLVAIGTHDLDAITPPFRYTARPPADIEFVPLAQERSFTAPDLFKHYHSANSPIKKFLPIIENSPVYPLVLDAKDRVLSLPPIINGNHSRISVDTKNVLIECTATDLTKGNIVLNTVIAMFSEYSSTPFSVEPMVVKYPKSHPPSVAAKTVECPNLAKHSLTADVAYIQKAIGLTAEQLPPANIPPLLKKMMLEARLEGDHTVHVTVPITRPDVMHACDVMEDVAVSYSYAKIPRAPAPIMCTGKQQPLSKLTDLMRIELAQAGYTEAMTFALCSHDEAFGHMRRADDGKQAAVIGNPKTVEFQVCRTSLLPGLFKTFANNKSNPLPWKLFEVQDTIHLDPRADVGASNRRRIAVVYSNSETSGFEVLHGLVERLMAMLDQKPSDFGVRKGTDATFLDGRCAEVFLTKTNTVVGTFGTVHPEVLEAFDLEFPTSAIDIDLEAFL